MEACNIEAVVIDDYPCFNEDRQWRWDAVHVDDGDGFAALLFLRNVGFDSEGYLFCDDIRDENGEAVSSTEMEPLWDAVEEALFNHYRDLWYD